MKIPKRDSYDPTESEVEKLRLLVESGAHTYKIFAEMRISATVGYRWLETIGLEPARFVGRTLAKPLDAKEEAEFRSYYKTSPGRVEIYKKYKIKKSTLAQWLEQLNLDWPKPVNARSRVSAPLTVVSERRLYERLRKDAEKEPHVSIADRFRAQGLATYRPK